MAFKMKGFSYPGTSPINKNGKEKDKEKYPVTPKEVVTEFINSIKYLFKKIKK